MAFGRRHPPPSSDPRNADAAPASLPGDTTSPPIAPIEPGQTQAQVDTSKNIVPAVEEITELLLKSYATGDKFVNAETVIGAAAALAGEYALRSTGQPLPQTPTYIAGGPQDGILYTDMAKVPAGPTAWGIIVMAALQAGAAPGDVPSIPEVMTRTVAAFGKSPFPPLTVPLQYWPKEWSPNAGPRLRYKLGAIGIKYDLSAAELVLALAGAIARLIAMTKDVLAPAIAATLAAEIMIGTSRMSPLTEPMGDGAKL
jgi:hypothetical protein